MKKSGKYLPRRRRAKRNARTRGMIRMVFLCLLAVAVVAGAMLLWPRLRPNDSGVTTTVTTTAPTAAPTTAPTDPTDTWKTGLIAAVGLNAEYYDGEGTLLGTLPRGTEVKYEVKPDGKTEILVNGVKGFLQEGASAVSNLAQIIPAHTLYVRTAVNLRDKDGKLLESFAEKGTAVNVTGYDAIGETGLPHMYRVTLNDKEGYIMPWYLVDQQEDALANYDNGNYATHVDRGNRYGGGDAADLDYYPREKGAIAGNEMPQECRALYLVAWKVSQVDDYLKLVENSGINAFVVDIMDGGSVGYAGDVMKAYSPSAAAAAKNTVAEYQTAIKKIKDAGYYVIGRITTFNDSYFIKDHPEYAITNKQGSPLKLSGEYWPTAYNRTAWQYKVDLAAEAVELMGFNEIQFDYVRFPDRTSSYENAGTIDFHNTYGESKAQAIQRFLMYATDILHEKGVYVSADVYGESAYTYVTAYGQYWPAVSNVVDVISGMPYPDHFSANGSWLPWEHPYDTLHSWAKSVMYRQGETATPAVVRTWIQAYNAIREPYNTYGPNELAAQIKGLRDAGCTGGFMTWNSVSSIDKYRSLLPAFVPPKEENA